MNYQEAIMTISAMQCTISAIRRNDDEWEATEKAIEALESMPEYERLKKRDRPYRPTPYNKFYGKGVCRCGVVFLKKDTNFCGNCGQRLDWSEEEEREEEK